jgi:hypothetical protein
VIRRKTNRRHMTGDHHGRTAMRATLLVTALDGILGTHKVMHGHHRLDAGSVGHPVQPHAVGQLDIGVDASGLGDQHQLLVIGHEAGRQQPLGQIGRLVVVVELPLHRHTASGEVPHLRGDRGIGGVARARTR